MNCREWQHHIFSLASYLCGAHVSRVCSEFSWLLTAATVQFLFNVYGCEAGDPFCGDIDGVPLGQRGVLPGPTQINCRAFRATREQSVPPLDPCCRERNTLRTPGAVPRTHTHSYLKFGSHRKLEHIIQLPKFV